MTTTVQITDISIRTSPRMDNDECVQVILYRPVDADPATETLAIYLHGTLESMMEFAQAIADQVQAKIQARMNTTRQFTYATEAIEEELP